MTFEKIKEQSFDDKKIKVIIFRHKSTKTIYYHIETDTNDNSFNISFKTLLWNRKGAPHVLEHRF